MGANDLKKYNLKPSGRRSIFRGAKYQRGFVINPQQILSLFHDTHQNLPIPADAIFKGLGIQDAGVDSSIEFYYTSELAPEAICFAMRPDLFFRLLKELAEGMIPQDAELDGIEISPRWTYVMLRVSSSHWPAAQNKADLPMVHLRYDLGQLHLVDMSQVVTSEKMIRIN